MKDKDIIDAYCRIRTIDTTIPDDMLDFMKDAALNYSALRASHAELLKALKYVTNTFSPDSSFKAIANAEKLIG